MNRTVRDHADRAADVAQERRCPVRSQRFVMLVRSRHADRHWNPALVAAVSGAADHGQPFKAWIPSHRISTPMQMTKNASILEMAFTAAGGTFLLMY